MGAKKEEDHPCFGMACDLPEKVTGAFSGYANFFKEKMDE
jgi:hypothetical protein